MINICLKERRVLASKFSQQEREYIYNQLLKSGRELFGNHGLSKTTISELTNQVGIAQGTFYHFFESKEALYFEIVEQEESYIREKLLNKVLLKGKLTKETFRDFLQQALQFLDESPMLRQLFDQSTMDQLLRKLPQEKLESNNKGDINFLMPYIEQWQADGVMKKLPPDTIVSIIRSLIILSLQKEMIGESNYKSTMDQLVQFISEGLIND